jgi:hypothetical protein
MSEWPSLVYDVVSDLCGIFQISPTRAKCIEAEQRIEEFARTVETDVRADYAEN